TAVEERVSVPDVTVAVLRKVSGALLSTTPLTYTSILPCEPPVPSIVALREILLPEPDAGLTALVPPPRASARQVTPLIPAGTKSVIVTPVACEKPVFITLIV